MMRSLFSGVSGLKSHQTRMDVIGNNIANVNTTGYKSKKLNFSDMLYQTTQAASGPSNNVGGINPRQIGLGVKTAAINTTITQEGATQSTGNPFDLKLTGEAFFVVSDGTNTYYTRDGSFDVDKAGNLCMASTGYIVKGWPADDEGRIIDGAVSNLNVMAKNSYDAAATTKASASGMIDATDTNLETKNGKIMNLQVLDNKGYEYNLQFGILPQKITTSGTRDIQNTETTHNLPDPLYLVDTSKIEYSYVVGAAADGTGGETRFLSSTESPELIAALDKAIWADVAAGTSGHEIGKKDEIKITINEQWLKDHNLDVIKYTELLGDKGGPRDYTVSFSGDTGFSSKKPDYTSGPVTDASKINEKAVALFYTIDKTTGECKRSANMDKITVTKQDYEDDNGNAITDYIFKDSAGNVIKLPAADGGGEIPKELYDDIVKTLKLGQEDDLKYSYITKEPKETTSIDPGKYTISLLGMSSEGEPIDISSLLNNGTTSWTLAYNKDNGTFDYVGEAGSKEFNLALSTIDTKFSNVSIDMSDTSNQFNEGKSSITAEKDDGYKAGTMKGVSIANDGIITANYSNGMSLVLGQICVATFANSMGLQNEGDNLYSETANSGDCQTVDIKASGTGYMTTGVLEMSNVDLSQEFTDMITTQRGFQANSRIITTSDTLLEELVNLKR